VPRRSSAAAILIHDVAARHVPQPRGRHRGGAWGARVARALTSVGWNNNYFSASMCGGKLSSWALSSDFFHFFETSKKKKMFVEEEDVRRRVARVSRDDICVKR
jgi:hypothetical protein